MELGADFWSSLLAIVVIDLVLAGDNAIVIGLAARRLPKEMRRKVVVWGTVGAVAIRSLLTLGVVWLLGIPGLLAAGGLMLAWIAYKLLADEHKHDISAPQAGVWAAIRTIIVADAVMGLDNVLAVAGAAHGSFALVLIGLLISVPIVVWGSGLILKAADRFPAVPYIGAGVLAWTAAKMIAGEPWLKPAAEAVPYGKWYFAALVVTAVLLLGRAARKKRGAAGSEPLLSRDAS